MLRKNRSIKSIFVLLAVTVMLFPACDDSKNRTQIKLSYQERRIVDTIYKERVLKLAGISRQYL